MKTRDCHDQAAPFGEHQQTVIDITHSDHQISQLSDGFLTFKVKLRVRLTGLSEATFQDNYNNTKIFIGLKSSNQLWDEMGINCRD